MGEAKTMRVSECPCPSCQIIRLVKEEQRTRYGSDDQGRARYPPEEIAKMVAKVWGYHVRSTWEVSPADAARMMDILTARVSEQVLTVFSEDPAEGRGDSLMRHKPSPRKTRLILERVVLRIPDRGRGFFGAGRRVATELPPPGHPSDVYGDVLVTVSRVKALEARWADESEFYGVLIHWDVPGE
jgi:hypothetical protein